MIRPTIYFSSVLFLISCSQSDSSKGVQDNWTENQEIHFYLDCKNKMLDHGENEENAHAFCSCCLVKLKGKYSDGKEAMHELTDEIIAEIEEGCSLKK